MDFSSRNVTISEREYSLIAEMAEYIHFPSCFSTFSRLCNDPENGEDTPVNETHR
jgi:hypothetical protein